MALLTIHWFAEDGKKDDFDNMWINDVAKIQATNAFLGHNLALSDGKSFSDDEDWKFYIFKLAKQDDLFGGLSDSLERSDSKKGDSQIPKAWKSRHS